MNKRPDSIVLAEQQVAEAWAAALDEYQAARAQLRRRMSSPVFIGGVLLGAIALGYFAFGRGNPKRLVYPESPGAWSRVVRTVQVLLPLLIALNSATKAQGRAQVPCEHRRNSKVTPEHESMRLECTSGRSGT